jgi:hypothetical protein
VCPIFVEISLGVNLVLLVGTLAVDSSGDEDRSQGNCKAKPDHAKLLLNMFSPKNTSKYFMSK